MYKAVTLETDRLILEPLGLKYLSHEYVDWMNDPVVYQYLESGGKYSIELLKEYLNQVESRNILFWAIHLKSDNKHIGNIKIDPINIKHGFGEYGIIIGERSEWGKGYAFEASSAVIDFIFSELKLRKLTLGVITENETAVGLYYKLGFALEGVYKKHVLYNNQYSDVYRMALFNDFL
jgi:ribosomal-protein-alanine N-acetyltransferase